MLKPSEPSERPDLSPEPPRLTLEQRRERAIGWLRAGMSISEVMRAAEREGWTCSRGWVSGLRKTALGEEGALLPRQALAKLMAAAGPAQGAAQGQEAPGAAPGGAQAQGGEMESEAALLDSLARARSILAGTGDPRVVTAAAALIIQIARTLADRPPGAGDAAARVVEYDPDITWLEQLADADPTPPAAPAAQEDPGALDLRPVVKEVARRLQKILQAGTPAEALGAGKILASALKLLRRLEGRARREHGPRVVAYFPVKRAVEAQEYADG